jgi:hypothetical protein
MKKILIAILLLVPSFAFATSELKKTPPPKLDGPRHIRPLCSCIGNIHIPFKEMRYKPTKK